MKVLDFSNARLDVPTLAQLHAAGQIAGVMRYLGPLNADGSSPWPKALTRAELASYQAAGIPVALNYETTGRSFRGGHAQGVLDGQAAGAWRKALGLDNTVAIYFSTDTSITTADVPLVVDYQHGIADGIGEPEGYYGPAVAFAELIRAGVIRTLANGAYALWEPNARGWAGDGIDDPHAALVQRVSHSFPQFAAGGYDESDLFVTDWGQHPRPNTAPATPVLEDNMLIPRRVTSTVPGRDAWIKFDPASGTLTAFGLDFADDGAWNINRALAAGHVIVATLKVAYQGHLWGPADNKDGTKCVVAADGDGGTFELAYANVDPAPAAPASGMTDAHVTALVEQLLEAHGHITFE
jgi:hypothetical protein